MNPSLWKKIVHIAFLIRHFSAEIQKSDSSKKYFDEKLSFCEAHAACYEDGLSKEMTGYMIGKEFRELITLHQVDSEIWLNYHALTCETKVNNTRYWTFGETPDEHDETIFKKYIESKLRSSATRFSVYSVQAKIKPLNAHNIRRSFVCGYRSLRKTNSNARTEKFVHNTSAQNGTLVFYRSDVYGCYEKWENLTLLGCAMK